MKRAWRLDPAWIAHYQRRDEEREKREIERLRIETNVFLRNLERELNDPKRAVLGILPPDKVFT